MIKMKSDSPCERSPEDGTGHGFMSKAPGIMWQTRAKFPESPRASLGKSASFYVVASVFCCLVALPAYATAPAQGGACTTNYTAAADATGNNLICVSSVWQYPVYTLASATAAGGGSCSTAGTLHYNSTIVNIEYCNGSNWAAPAGGGGSSVIAGVAGQMAYYASTGSSVSGNANATISSGTLTLGVGTTTPGALALEGSSSGAVTVNSTSGTYNFILPTAAGTAGQALLSAGGSSAMTFGTVGVAGGGTGSVTFPAAHGLLVGEGTSAIGTTAAGGANTVLVGQGVSSDPIFSATPTLGGNGGTGGSITFNGSASGSVIVQTANAAGTSTKFQLPSTNGTSYYILQTDGTGVTSWVQPTTGATISLGTSTSLANPAVAGDPTTGFYTSGAAHVDVSISGTQMADVTTNVFNLTSASGAYQINGNNAISFPTSDTTAGGSIAIGPGALAHQPASAAYGNTAIGYNAMSSASMTTAAVHDTAVGYQALAAITSGNDDTAVGYKAGATLTSGSYDTAYGYLALGNGATTVSYDSALGYEALQNDQSAAGNNSAAGAFALSGSLTGGYNTTIGYATGQNMTSGAGNVLLGYNAGKYISTGSYNVAAGNAAMLGNSTPANYLTGNYNVAIGSLALTNLQSGATGNVGFGEAVGATLTTGSHNILIGTNTHAADVPSASTSDRLNIGSFIEGDMNLSHNFINGAAPTSIGTGTADCGTSPTLVGNDTLGLVTVGSSTNGGVCTITFKTAWTNAPICFAQDQTTANLEKPISTTTTLKITGTLTAGDAVSYMCIGYRL